MGGHVSAAALGGIGQQSTGVVDMLCSDDPDTIVGPRQHGLHVSIGQGGVLVDSEQPLGTLGLGKGQTLVESASDAGVVLVSDDFNAQQPDFTQHGVKGDRRAVVGDQCRQLSCLE